MKRSILILAFAFALAPTIILAAPGIPHQFYGTVNFSNGSAPDGLLVEVKVNGAKVGSATTSGGKYGYMPSLLFAIKTEGDWNGETAELYVGGTKATTVTPVTLSKGGYTQLNLTVPGTAPTSNPTPPPAPAPTPAPTSNGGGSSTGDGINPGSSSTSSSSSVATPTSPTALSATAQKVDANEDNKIDKYDFSLLMANWGKTGANVCDFNGDGKVDKYDFSLLMLNWSM